MHAAAADHGGAAPHYASSSPQRANLSRVASHPVLDRLSPELRGRVLLELQAMAGRPASPGSRSHHHHPHHPRPHHHFSHQPPTPPPPPPENHRHGSCQTAFPADAMVQTDPAGPGHPGVGASPPPLLSHAAAGTSPPPPQQQHYAAHSVERFPSTEAFIASHPLVQTTPDGRGGAASSPAQAGAPPPQASSVLSDAHARFVMGRITAAEQEKAQGGGGPGHRTLGPEWTASERYGFPNPDEFAPPAAAADGGGGGGLRAEDDAVVGGEGWKRRVQEEFWREFNLEFDRAVLQRRDPEMDALLDEYARPSALVAAQAAAPPAQQAAARPASSSPRDAARLEAQDTFWQEYTQSLDTLLPAGGSRGAGGGGGGGYGGHGTSRESTGSSRYHEAGGFQAHPSGRSLSTMY